MSNVKDFSCRIGFVHEGKMYKIFTLGYYPDGGYFITDLANTESYTYIASLMLYNGTGEPRETFISPIDKDNTYSISLKNPKISHHIDGSAHISGKDIRSGYNPDGTPKGLSIKSSNLYGGNDGGPMFIFSVGLNTINIFPCIDIEDEKFYTKRHLILNKEILVDLRKDEDEGFNYIIEGYYFHKNNLPDDMRDGLIFHKLHPGYGIIPLIPLPSPAESPYIFAIGYIKDPLCHNPDSLSYGGAPGIIDKDGKWGQLHMYLTQEDPKYKSLDYKS